MELYEVPVTVSEAEEQVKTSDLTFIQVKPVKVNKHLIKTKVREKCRFL